MAVCAQRICESLSRLPDAQRNARLSAGADRLVWGAEPAKRLFGSAAGAGGRCRSGQAGDARRNPPAIDRLYADATGSPRSAARFTHRNAEKSCMNAHTTPESDRLTAKVQRPGRDPFVAVKFLRQKRQLDIPDRSGKRQSMSVLEAQFALRVRVAKLPEPQREYRFDAMRRWKFDFAWPNWKIAVECEGGIWTQGRHTRALGFEADCSKYNAATVQGWRVLRFTAGMVKSGAAVELLTQAIQQAACGASNALFLVEKQEVGNVGKRWASFLRHERSVARRGNGGFARACLPIYLVPFRYRNVFAD